MGTYKAPEKTYVHDLFITDLFRDSWWVRGICADVGKIWICDEEPVRDHLGTYFGSLYRRRLSDPYLQDLYHLKEIVRSRLLCHTTDTTWLKWYERMLNAEFQAGYIVDCEAFAMIPGLRAHVTGELWVDRYDLMQDYQGELRSTWIRKRRLEAIRTPDVSDFLSMRLHAAAALRAEWCRIWSEPVGIGPFSSRPAFRVVEEHMSSPDRDATHLAWLEKVKPLGGTDNPIPFYRQAEAYAAAVAAVNKRYGDHFLSL